MCARLPRLGAPHPRLERSPTQDQADNSPSAVPFPELLLRRIPWPQRARNNPVANTIFRVEEPWASVRPTSTDPVTLYATSSSPDAVFSARYPTLRVGTVALGSTGLTVSIHGIRTFCGRSAILRSSPPVIDQTTRTATSRSNTAPLEGATVDHFARVTLGQVDDGGGSQHGRRGRGCTVRRSHRD